MSDLANTAIMNLSVSGKVQLSEEQKRELDRRLASYHAKPEQGAPWAAVRARIRKGGQSFVRPR